MSNFCIDGFNRTEKNQKGLEKDETNKCLHISSGQR